MADPGEAMEWQRRMGAEVIAEDRLAPLHRVAGADVHYLPGGGAIAAVTVLSSPESSLVTAGAIPCRYTARNNRKRRQE